MSFPLADLLSPTPQLPKAAGGVVVTPEAAEEGAFAEALKAFRAAAAETAQGEAGIAAGEVGVIVPELPPRAQLDAVIGLETALVSGAAEDAGSGVEPPPAIGTSLADPAELPAAPILTEDGLPATAEDASVRSPETADAGLVAAAAPPAPTPPVPLATGMTVEEAALKVAAAAETPEIPLPAPQTPLAPAMTDAESAPDAAPLLEGRASVAGAPPPPPVVNTGDAIPTLPKDVLENFAPRAQAAEAAEAAAAAKPVTPQPAPATQSAPVPAALQAVVAEPDVVSVQAKAVAGTDANKDGESAPAVTTPAPRGTERAAAASTPSVPAPATPAEPLATEPVLAADPETRAKAADGALAVLTEKKTDASSAPAKPAPGAEGEPVAKPAAAASMPLEEPTVDVKTADPKTAPAEKPAPEKPVAERPAPAPADKPAPQADNRATQIPLPVNDKPAPVELAAKAVQQQSQSLPAAAIPQIAGEIVSRTKHGATRFEIRLDPPELGRIDVRIDVDKDGRVVSRLMVEKSETLDLLKADQRALERALHEAGFKSEQNSLSFSLKDQRDGQAKFDEPHQPHQPSEPAAPEEEPVRHAAETAYRAAMRGPGGFDLRV